LSFVFCLLSRGLDVVDFPVIDWVGHPLVRAFKEVDAGICHLLADLLAVIHELLEIDDRVLVEDVHDDVVGRDFGKPHVVLDKLILALVQCKGHLGVESVADLLTLCLVGLVEHVLHAILRQYLDGDVVRLAGDGQSLLCTPLRPRQVKAATLVEVRVADEANDGRLPRTLAVVLRVATRKEHATRTLLARVHEAAALIVVAL